MGLAHVRWAAVAEFGEVALRLLVHRRGSASAWRLLAGLGDLFEPLVHCIRLLDTERCLQLFGGTESVLHGERIERLLRQTLQKFTPEWADPY